MGWFFPYLVFNVTFLAGKNRVNIVNQSATPNSEAKSKYFIELKYFSSKGQQILSYLLTNIFIACWIAESLNDQLPKPSPKARDLDEMVFSH